MATPTQFPGDVRIAGKLEVFGQKPKYARDDFSQEAAAVYGVPLDLVKVWDNLASGLPATPANDDLGVVTGTWGTNSPQLETQDHKAAGSAQSNYGVFLFALPPEYQAGQDVTVRARAGMKTNTADTTATLDVEVYEANGDGGLEGSPTDLVQTAAQDINSLTVAEKLFTLDASNLAAGDLLMVRIHTAVNDAASGSNVEAIVTDLAMLLDIAG